MKFIIALLFFAVSTSLLAQSPTLKETEDWISYKIKSYGEVHEYYELNDEYGNFKSETITSVKVYFDLSGYMIFLENTNSRANLNGPLDGEDYTHSIQVDTFKIDMIQKVTITTSYDENTDTEQILLKVDLDEDKCIDALNRGEYLPKAFEGNYALKKSVLEEKMPERIEKAFDHLIELNGGSPIKEVF